MHYVNTCLTCLLFAGLSAWYAYGERRVMALFFRGLASLSFVMTGWLCSLLASDADAAHLVLLGLGLGFAADLLLGLRGLSERGERAFLLLGMLGFFGGQICLLAAAWPRGVRPWLAALLALPLTALLFFLLLRRGKMPKSVLAAGTLCLGALVLLNCALWSSFVLAPSRYLLLFAAGSALLLAGGVVLGLNGLRARNIAVRLSCLALYYLAQLLIALSLQLL